MALSTLGIGGDSLLTTLGIGNTDFDTGIVLPGLTDPGALQLVLDAIDEAGLTVDDYFVTTDVLEVKIGPAIYKVNLETVSVIQQEGTPRVEVEGTGYKIGIGRALLSLILSPEDGK